MKEYEEISVRVGLELDYSDDIWTETTGPGKWGYLGSFFKLDAIQLQMCSSITDPDIGSNLFFAEEENHI